MAYNFVTERFRLMIDNDYKLHTELNGLLGDTDDWRVVDSWLENLFHELVVKHVPSDNRWLVDFPDTRELAADYIDEYKAER